MRTKKMSVLLCTEGTYPFHQGGVSTWCDTLVNRLREIDYTVFSIVTDPFVTQKFTLPRATKLVRLPLWGTDEPSEHLDVRFSSTYLSKQRTTNSVIQMHFLPIFDEFIRELITESKNADRFASILLKMHDFFFEFDYKVAFKSPFTWNRYKRLMGEFSTGQTPVISPPDLYGLIQSLGWIYRFFNIINTRIPVTTVTHAAAASFCGLPGVIAKLKYDTPLLLTEHGVYIREQYLSLSKRGYSSFLNTFLIRMIQSVVHVTYSFADQISPVCEYNTRWEKKLTDRHERIEVIYNGVDHRVFEHVQARKHDRPTVVTVARIDPIKDIVTLIQAAHLVRQRISNVKFIIYGSTTVPEYLVKCQSLADELNLGGTVEFFGHTSDMAAAYDSGDVVVQSSISEAFPYAVIEAMLSGKPVISTAVGGVPEALGDTGLLVNPSDAEGLAQAIADMLSDEQTLLEQGQEARRRALDLFTLDKCLDQYLRTYIKLAVTSKMRLPESSEAGVGRIGHRPIEQEYVNQSAESDKAIQIESKKVQLLVERAIALYSLGHWSDASVQAETAWHASPSRATTDFLDALLEAAYKRMESQRAEPPQTHHSLENHRRLQHLFAERAYALAAAGHKHAAIYQMKAALSTEPNSLASPVFLYDLASWLEDVAKPQEAAEASIKADVLRPLLSKTS